IGAAIGREFSYALLRAVVGRDETVLKDALAQLEDAELVFRRGEPPEAIYSFKHALVRDAAYESLLKSRRQQLHGQIARTMVEKFPDIVASQPEIVAHHFTEAGLVEPAINYWFKAARGRGWSSDTVKHAYARAHQLSKESGLDKHTFSAVFGLWTWNFVRSLLEAQDHAEHLLNAAKNVDDPAYKVLAHEALGFTLFAQGKFAAAHEELAHGISLSENSAAAAYLDLTPQDPRVHVRTYDGMALYFLGYPDQALGICAEARLLADASQNPLSEAIARVIGLRVHQFRGEAAVIAGEVNGAIALCEKHDFPHYRAMALILRGWASAYQGEFEKGIAEMQEGLEQERTAGGSLYESYILGLLADACITNGRYSQALDFLDQAQSRLAEKNSERFYEAEIYRLLGETHLRLDKDANRAEHFFCRGLRVAREQKAKSLELKLCMSIYDLYELRQNADKFRPQLSEIYEFFSEGFDIADLIRAKARLKRLN